MSEPVVLTTGRLNGLHLQPCVDNDGALTHLHFTVDTLPGLRLIIEVAAVRELHFALTVVLCDNPKLPGIPATTPEGE